MSQTSDNNNLTEAGTIIEYLRSAITDGVAGLFDAPALLRQIIESEIWREHFVRQTQETVRFNSFDDFISAPPPEGLGVSKKILYRFCSDDVVILDLLDRTLKTPKRGGDHRSNKFKRNNVTIERQNRGNSVVYALRRLRSARPDVHARVLSKELSINQAMIMGGFRKKTTSLHLTSDMQKNADLIRRSFSEDEVRKLRKLLKISKKI